MDVDDQYGASIMFEEVRPENVQLVVGYITGTNLVETVAITDMPSGLSWVISDYGTQCIRQGSCYDEAFSEGTFHTYKYVGSADAIQEAYPALLSLSADDTNLEYWDLLEVCATYGINFDDHHFLNNNNERRSDFIKVNTQVFGGESDEC